MKRRRMIGMSVSSQLPCQQRIPHGCLATRLFRPRSRYLLQQPRHSPRCMHAATVFQVPPGGGEAVGWGSMAQTEYRQAWTANNCADRVAKAGGVRVAAAAPVAAVSTSVAAAAADPSSLHGAAWCVHMAHTHAVQPAVSWGSMELKTDQQRWKSEGCDQVTKIGEPPPPLALPCLAACLNLASLSAFSHASVRP